MKERPILFSGEMVRAILDGRKTVTRRVVKFAKPFTSHDSWKNVYAHPGGGYIFTDGPLNNPERDIPVMAAGRMGKVPPYGQPGDRLWVRETYFEEGHHYASYPEDDEYRSFSGTGRYFYAADGLPPVEGPNDWGRPVGERGHVKGNGKISTFFPSKGNNYWNKRPSIFMPREASRITLEVTGVRVERAQDITEEQAQAEGVSCGDCNGNNSRDCDDRFWFKELWDSLNASRGFGWDKNPWCWVVEFKRI